MGRGGRRTALLCTAHTRQWRQERHYADSSEQSFSHISRCTPLDVVKEIRRGQTVQLVDARQAVDFASKHLFGSVHVPGGDVSVARKLLSPKRPAFVYAEPDNAYEASRRAADQLKEVTPNVVAVDASIDDMMDAGFLFHESGTTTSAEENEGETASA